MLARHRKCKQEIEFINLIDSEGHATSLSISGEEEDFLTVFGVLGHGKKVRPETEEDYLRFIVWLESRVYKMWIGRERT